MTAPVKRYTVELPAGAPELHEVVLAGEYERLELECERLRETIRQLAALDIRGHQLQDRLQFSTDGRALLDRINSALQAKP